MERESMDPRSLAKERSANGASSPTRGSRRRNAIVAGSLVGVVIAMGALVYYSAPLYRIFCQVTGFGGTTQVAEAPPKQVSSRVVTVRFDANVATDMPWRFVAPAPVDVRLGEEKVVSYSATNLAKEPTLGTASYNVTPLKVGSYFDKIQCFCFTEQLLMPGETRELSVLFFVDPKIADDRNLDGVGTITLSYTFFNKGAAARDAYMRAHKIAFEGAAR